MAEFGAAAVRLSPAARERLARKGRLKKVIDKIVAEPDGPTERFELTPKSAVEVSHGAGLGEKLSEAAGQARLADYATPMMPTVWAGPLAGPSQLEREFGIARSTLHAWQRQRAVIAVQVGVRKHAFPVEQFIDGRPVSGLKSVVEAVGETRTAWRWLRESNPGLQGISPIARLRDGDLNSVLNLARSNFGRR